MLASIAVVPMTRDMSTIFIGQAVGRLTIVSDAGCTGGRRSFLCRCECGNEKVILAQSLRGGLTRSCGCYHAERASSANTKHGKSKHPIFKIWDGMLQRCSNPNNSQSEYYGDRGIKVCTEWANDFGAFLYWATLDASPCWRRGLTLDRKDNELGYNPQNCQWATPAEQNRNQRRTKKYDFDGEQLVATDIAKRLGISAPTFLSRVGRLGWSFEDAISIPVQRRSSP